MASTTVSSGQSCLSLRSQALKPGADTALDAAALEAIAEEAPSATLPRDQVVGATIVDVAVATGVQPSKGAARRLIKVRNLSDVHTSSRLVASAHGGKSPSRHTCSPARALRAPPHHGVRHELHRVSTELGMPSLMCAALSLPAVSVKYRTLASAKRFRQ